MGIEKIATWPRNEKKDIKKIEKLEIFSQFLKDKNCIYRI